MSRRKSSRRQLESLCADVHPDDGQDPKEFFSSTFSNSQKQGRTFPRKTLQLCSQVADTLNLVLSGECADECLQCLQVVSVTPAPNAAQLLVVVSPSSGGPAPDPVPCSSISPARTGGCVVKWPPRSCGDGCPG